MLFTLFCFFLFSEVDRLEITDFDAAFGEPEPEAGNENMVAYNENQPSYRAEVTKALDGDPDSLFLVAFPVDGITLTREWLSLGGTDKLIVNNSLRSNDYLEGVGEQYLKNPGPLVQA